LVLCFFFLDFLVSKLVDEIRMMCGICSMAVAVENARHSDDSSNIFTEAERCADNLFATKAAVVQRDQDAVVFVENSFKNL
jgi:hypothetical protein